MKFAMGKKKFLRDSIIILGISLAILFVSEMILRIAYHERVKSINIFVAYKFNDDYLISIKPNITKKFVRIEENGGYITLWKTNSNAFRGPELNTNPKYRVIVYGDSNIQARFSGRARTFTYQFAHYLNRNGIPDVEVINAGVVGFGPDQSLIRFTNEIDKYRPNLVIFHIFADNDFGDILRNRLLSLDVNGNLIDTGYKNTVDENILISTRLKFFISNLLTVRAFKKMILSLVKGNLSDEIMGKNNKKGVLLEHGKENRINKLEKMCGAEYLVYKESKPRQFSHFADHYDIDIALNPDQDSSKTKIRLMAEVLKEANNVAYRKGVKFLVLIQPSIVDMTKDNSILSYEYLRKFPKYKRTNLTDAVEKICVSHNINFINLFNLFIKNNPEDLFFRAGDDHWTDQGQRLAAKEAALYMIQRAMIEKE